MTRKSLLQILAVAATAICMWGCSDANPDAPAFSQGDHPEGWEVEHGQFYLEQRAGNKVNCTQCHGDELDGGISGVSCYSCHSFSLVFGDEIGHPEYWNADTPVTLSSSIYSIAGEVTATKFHGAAAKGFHQEGFREAPYGFDYCAGCHGEQLEGGFAGISCWQPNNASCHQGYPHPEEWVGPTYHHALTNPQNAEFCSMCHQKDPAAPEDVYVLDTRPADKLSAAGCFNNTMCHGPKSIHTDTFAYSEINGQKIHGLAAKQYPADPANGMISCTACHFDGAPGITSCVTCHSGAAHPEEDWAEKHYKTSPGNARACSRCHQTTGTLYETVEGIPVYLLDAATTPASELENAGCFNNTLCHGRQTPHESGWRSEHGDAAIFYNQTSAEKREIWGFVNCNKCHGPAFSGVAVQPSCTNTVACHGTAAAHPKSSIWEEEHGSSEYFSYLAGQASSCAVCHTNFANSCSFCHSDESGTWSLPFAQPTCFNSTMCHPHAVSPEGAGD